MNHIKILFLLLLANSLTAQQKMTLNEVIDLTVKHNFDLQISQNQVMMNQNEATIGNAGYLPTVDVSGGYTFSISNTYNKFAGNLPEANENGAMSHNYNASLDVNYTIFDGLRPKYTLQKSKVDIALAQTNYQKAVEDKVFQVIQAYYNLAMLEADYALAEEKIQLTQAQIDRLKGKRKFGQGSATELLNLQTVYHNDSTQLLRLAIAKEQRIRELNILIGKEVLPLDMQTTIDLDLDLSLNYDVLKKKLEGHPLLRQAKLNVNKSDLDIKLAQTAQFPRVTTQLSYGFSGQNNDVGILLENRNLGPSVNVGVNYTIFNGGQRKTQVNNAKLMQKNSQLSLRSVEYQLQQQLKEAYANHQNNLDLLLLVERNLGIAQASFERTEKAYKLGQATYLDYLQAQFNYIQIKQQVQEAEFNAKLSEWTMLKVVGALVE